MEYEIYVPLNVLEELQLQRENSQAAASQRDNPQAVASQKEEFQADGPSVEIFIHHYFTDAEQRLYGFLDPLHKEFFKSLQDVKGCGPALALSLLSHLEAVRIVQLCSSRDTAALCKVPRVGKATAERLIFEINRRKKKWDRLFGSGAGSGTSESLPLEEHGFNPEQELALQALLQLGYRESVAKVAIERAAEKICPVDQDVRIGPAEWIRAALRSM